MWYVEPSDEPPATVPNTVFLVLPSVVPTQALSRCEPDGKRANQVARVFEGTGRLRDKD